VAGDVVGDFDFSRAAAYDAAAVCAEDSEILSFPGRGATMDDLVRERPDVSARILLRTVAMISSRVRSTQALISENAPWVRELRRQMYTDSATGLWSRAFLDDELARSIEPPAAVLLCKPDRFKELCDGWTHAAGDAAMERIAALLKDEARALRRAWAVRMRSNETAVIAAGCGREQAAALAERIRASYAAMDLSPITGSPDFRLSASVAIAAWPDDGRDFKELVEQAYGLMTRAWKDGGDRVYRLGDAERRGGAGGRR
ncbi:MAG TPA: diguanylate cyclase, partial [Spirochaetales bacterium]|nr:diguanylate cyclase [Spirochaetales bacterium]